MSMELDPRADRLRENDDRSIDAYECRDFIWPGGTRSFTEFVSQDGSRLCRGVRGRGVEFRRSIVGGFPPRHAASISVPRPRRVVRWLRFNNSSRLPAGTDSSRDSIQRALITIRRRRAGSDLANAAPHSRIFGTDWNPTLRRDFARSRIIHNFWSIESSITKSLSFFFKVIFKSVSRAATKIRATKSFVWKINISAYHFCYLIDIFKISNTRSKYYCMHGYNNCE